MPSVCVLVLSVLLLVQWVSSCNLTTEVIAYLNSSTPENLAVRPNGQILVTSATPLSQLFLVDPRQYSPPLLIGDFKNINGSFGITEVEPDVFYMAVGNLTFNGTYVTPPSGFAIWKVDMTCFQALPSGEILSPPSLEKLVDMPDGALINGMAHMPSPSNTVPNYLLAADSLNGVVWSISLPRHGLPEVAVAINDTSMLPPTPHSLGINGIKYFNSTVYYTNSFKSSFFSRSIDPLTATASPSSFAHFIANVTVPDDLILNALHPNQGAYFGSQGRGAVQYLDFLTGEVVTVSSEAGGPSAVAFGKGANEGRLYVTLNGGDAGSVHGIGVIDIKDCEVE